MTSAEASAPKKTEITRGQNVPEGHGNISPRREPPTTATGELHFLYSRSTIFLLAWEVWRRAMDHDEQRKEAQQQPEKGDGRREEDPRRFERIGREVRKGQSPNTGEEGTEEERRQWEKTRDISKEIDAISEEAEEQRRQARDD